MPLSTSFCADWTRRNPSLRSGRRVVAAAVTAAIVASLGFAGAAPNAFAASTAPVARSSQHAVATNVVRVSGGDRLQTAIATSKDQFPTAASATAVVLARSDTFPDALAGGPLAAKVGGPLLLTSAGGLDTAVLAEIERVAPKGSTVYVLGSTAGIKGNVDTALTAAGYTPKRVEGVDRFATAVAIADQMGDPTTVFEATGLNFPDALAAGPAAIKSGGVILLTNGSAQSTATAAYLAAHSGGTHYALGGPAVAADPAATALNGTDRYWTAAGVAEQFFPTATVIGAATGLNFPDALAAGPDLAAKGAPLLLVPTTGTLPTSVALHLLANEITLTNAVVFGGTPSVSDAVASQVGALATAHAASASADTSTAYTGAFGVRTEQVNLTGLKGTETVVVDASTGDVTLYKQGAATATVSAALAPRAQLATLPVDNLDNLETAANAMYASADTAEGITSTDPDELFTINAEQILLDPVAPQSVRLAVYAALASDDGLTLVTAGAKDSLGRVGIEIYAPLGTDPTDKSKISYIFDPNTLLPLEDTVLDPSGAVITRETITSMTTVATMPTDPYSS